MRAPADSTGLIFKNSRCQYKCSFSRDCDLYCALRKDEQLKCASLLNASIAELILVETFQDSHIVNNYLVLIV